MATEPPTRFHTVFAISDVFQSNIGILMGTKRRKTPCHIATVDEQRVDSDEPSYTWTKQITFFSSPEDSHDGSVCMVD